MNADYRKTLETFTSDIKANPLMTAIFETDEEIKTQWLLEIEYAIGEGCNDIPQENLAAFDAKPSDWLNG